MSTKNEKKEKQKFIKKGNGKEPTVIEFNLSKAVILFIIIGVTIATITTVKVITSISKAQENKQLAGDEETNVIWVESTYVDEDGSTVVDLDEEGNPIKVPVPKGYTASKIPGETSANSGFVIYEGEVDWNSILVGTTSENSIDTQSSLNETTTQPVEENPSNTTTENVSTDNTISENEETSTSTETTQSEEINQEQENGENDENTIFLETEEVENLNDVTNVENETEKKSDSIEKNIEENNIDDEIADLENETILEETTIESGNNESITEESEDLLNIQTEDNNSIEVLADETTNTEARATTTDINIFNLQKSTNQYVWIPVKDPSRIYGVDANKKYWGKLYRFPDSDSGSRTPYSYSWSETDGVMSIGGSISYREPDVMHYNTNYDIDGSLQGYLDGRTQYELLSMELEENFHATIKSIKEYGGFYIGRYETGGISETAVVRKMDTDLGGQTWYTMYEKCKTLNGTNDDVMTSMIWGSLWDETLQWLVDSKATNSYGTVITYSLLNDSTTWGNYYNVTFDYISESSTTPDATSEKTRNEGIKIPTGSSDYTKVNNIYDLAGNMYDRTLEAYSTNNRIFRGGYYGSYGNYYPATIRSYNIPTTTHDYYGCRAILLIQ